MQGTGTIVNADISAAAAISLTKLAGAYIAYTPTWTASGTAPAIGNATVFAQYVQIGKFVHAYGRILFGSTSTYGTGTYSFALPVTASGIAQSSQLAGSGMGYNGNRAQFAADIPTTTTLSFAYGATYLGTDTTVGQLAPFTWTTNGVIEWNITYEAA